MGFRGLSLSNLIYLRAAALREMWSKEGVYWCRGWTRIRVPLYGIYHVESRNMPDLYLPLLSASLLLLLCLLCSHLFVTRITTNRNLRNSLLDKLLSSEVYVIVIQPETYQYWRISFCQSIALKWSFVISLYIINKLWLFFKKIRWQLNRIKATSSTLINSQVHDTKHFINGIRQIHRQATQEHTTRQNLQDSATRHQPWRNLYSTM